MDTYSYDCLSKPDSISLIQYDRVVQLDSDILILEHMDGLMDL